MGGRAGNTGDARRHQGGVGRTRKIRRGGNFESECKEREKGLSMGSKKEGGKRKENEERG